MTEDTWMATLATTPPRKKGVETTLILRQDNHMDTVLEIGKLSRTEKLRAMEELWEDLSRPVDQYQAPEWHGDILREREEALQAGKDEFVSWEDAKRVLRERTK